MKTQGGSSADHSTVPNFFGIHCFTANDLTSYSKTSLGQCDNIWPLRRSDTRETEVFFEEDPTSTGLPDSEFLGTSIGGRCNEARNEPVLCT